MPVDKSVTNCQVCGATFSFTKRRHWCRACQRVICANCSSAFAGSLISVFQRRHEDNKCVLCERALVTPHAAGSAATTASQSRPVATTSPLPSLPPPQLPASTTAAEPQNRFAGSGRPVSDDSHSHSTAPVTPAVPGQAPRVGQSGEYTSARSTATATPTAPSAAPTAAEVAAVSASPSLVTAASNTAAAAATRIAQGRSIASAPRTLLPPQTSNFAGSVSVTDKGRGGVRQRDPALGCADGRVVAAPGHARSFRNSSMSFRGMSFVNSSSLRAPGASFRRRLGSSESHGGGSSGMAIGAVSSFGDGDDTARTDSSASLRSLPLGSLPPQFFLAKRAQSRAAVSSMCTVSHWHRFLSRSLPQIADEAHRPPLEHLTWIAEADGLLMRDHLRACLQLLVDRHPILRCSFRNGDLYQFASAEVDFRYLSDDMTHGTNLDIRKVFQFEMERPFDASRAQTLMRVRVLRLPTQASGASHTSHLLGIVLHCAIADVASLSILLDDLRTLYKNARTVIRVSDAAAATTTMGGDEGERAVSFDSALIDRLLPQLSATFTDYCEFEAATVADEENAAAQRAFWIGEVRDRMPTSFKYLSRGCLKPSTVPPATGNDASGKTPKLRRSPRATSIHPLPVGDELQDSIKSWASQCGASSAVSIMAALALLLHRYTGNETVTIANPISTRMLAEFEDVIGPMTNWTARTITFPDASLRCTELVERLRARINQSLAHNAFPFPLVVDAVAADDTLRPGCFPLSEVAFVYEPFLHPTEKSASVSHFLLGLPGAVTDLGGLTLRSTRQCAVSRASMFDLTLHAWEVRGRLHLAFEYNTELIEEDSITHLAENFKHLLHSAALSPGSTVGSVRLLGEAQRRQLLFDFNDTMMPTIDARMRSVPFPGVQSLFDEGAARWGAAPAIVMPEADAEGRLSELSYAQLEALSNRLAHVLRERYFVPDDGVEVPSASREGSCFGALPRNVVAICMPRCVEQIVCVLAILKAGGSYLPLDVSYPVDRLAFMLDDSNVCCIMTSTHIQRSNPQLWTRIANGNSPLLPVAEALEEITKDASSEPIDASELQLKPTDCTYVIYTSGSTGRPKGVLMNHRALLNLILWQDTAVKRRTADGRLNVLQFSPISFDVSFQELFSTWYQGGTVFMVTEQLRLDPVSLVRFMNKHAIHRIFLPFVALSHIADVAEEVGDYPTALQDVITAGEQLVISRSVVKLFERLHEGDDHVALHNHYGPSETHVCSSHVLRGNPHTWPPLPPIGKPIGNTELFVLDEQGSLVPSGVPGELYIAGQCLGNGYLNRPDATNAAFIPTSFAAASSERMYKTGDMVVMLPDGNICYLRRKDTQVKLRGFRIELGEVEAKLSAHESVQKCCVILRGDLPEGSGLVAFCVAVYEGENTSNLVADLKSCLKQTMPTYMVPAHFVFFQHLPVTPSGKINRKELATVDVVALERQQQLQDSGDDTSVGTGGAAHQAPTTPMELLVERIWLAVLRVPKVETHSNFFDLGGHSLLVAKVAARLSTALRFEVPMSVPFDNPSLGGLAAALERLQQHQQQQSETAESTSSATGDDAGSKYLDDVLDGEQLLDHLASTLSPSLTFNQQSMLFLSQMKPEAAAMNNISMQGSLHGDVSVAELTDAFEKVLQTHPILRTTYDQDAESGAFRQTVHENVDCDFNVVVEYEEDVSLTREAILGILAEEATRPFCLESDSMMRVRLYRFPSDTVLQIVFHHIAVDLWSIALIFDQIGGLLGLPSSAGASSSGSCLRYSEYAKYMQQRSNGRAFASSAAAWQNRLKSSTRAPPVLELPTDLPRPPVMSHRGSVIPFTVPQELATKLSRIAAIRSTTMYHLLLSVLGVTLHKLTRQDEVVVGTPMACRNSEKFEHTVGYFINSVPLCMSFVGGEQPFADIIAQCRDEVLFGLQHQEYPFPLLADRVVGSRSTSHTPIFQTMMIFQKPHIKQELMPFFMFRDGLRMQLGRSTHWESIAVPSTHAMYDLVWQFAELPQTGELAGSIEFATDLFLPATVQSFIDVFLHLAEQAVDSSLNVLIAELNIAPPSHTERVLHTFNRLRVDSRTGNVLTRREEIFATFGKDLRISIQDRRCPSWIQVFRHVAAANPDLTAVHFGVPAGVAGGTGVASLSFAQLDAQSDALAAVILQRAADATGGDTVSIDLRDHIIGVSLRRSVELIVTLVAVLKTGAAYVPLDPGYPPERLHYMTEDAGVVLVIARQCDQHLFEGKVHVEALEELMHRKASSAAQDRVQFTIDADGDSLAYVIYTSGSTGKPKGTLLEHRGLVNMCHAIRIGYQMEFAKSRFLLFASSSFDASVLEIFCPLANACTVVMLSEAPIVGKDLADAMAVTGVTTAVLPPPVLAVMDEAFFPPSSLRVLVTAGEAINEAQLRRWGSKPGLKLLNAYGPTENTVASTICDYRAERVTVVSLDWHERLGSDFAAEVARLAREGCTLTKGPPIGGPIPNACCYVVDEQLRPVAIGVPGELVVTGPGVARGYHKQVERTAKAFLPNAFHPQLFDRVYRTGDLVRWLPSGNLEFLGRIDAQVKLRGYRIELGEVENVLMRFGDGNVFADVAVDLRQLPSGPALVAYVVLRQREHDDDREREGPPTPAQLKAFVTSQVPEYMCPSAFVLMAKLPLTPSAKVDRKALPQPFAELVGLGNENAELKVAPATPTEAVLVELVQEVLGKASAASISDDFFAIGGHSLAAMQLVSRIRETFQVEMTIAKMFEASQLRSIAECIDAVRGSREEVTLEHRFGDTDAGTLATALATHRGTGSNGDVTSPSGGGSPQNEVPSPDCHIDEDEDEEEGVNDAASPTNDSSAGQQMHFPLSFNQEAMWYAYVGNRGDAAYNVQFVARFETRQAAEAVTLERDVAALHKAVQALVVLHPMLRTSFSDASGTPTQRIHARRVVANFKLQWWLSSQRGEAARRAELERITHEPLCLEDGYVFRVVALAEAEGEDKSPARITHIAMVMHHIVSDLVSVELLVEQLGALYCAAAAPGSALGAMDVVKDMQRATTLLKRGIIDSISSAVRPSSFEPLANRDAVNYADFAFWQREMMTSSAGEKLFAYWQRHLSGAPIATEAPFDFPRPPVPCSKGAAEVVAFPRSLASSIAAAARAMSATPVSVLMASVFAWLYRVTEQNDLVIGTPVSSRTRTSLETVVGDFVDLCPIRVQLPTREQAAAGDAVSFRQLVGMSKNALIGALANQEYPFGQLVKRLQRHRDPSRTPFFQVLLVHEKPHHRHAALAPFILGDEGGSLTFTSGVADETSPELHLRSTATEERTAQFDLVFAFSEGADGHIDCRIQYNVGLYKRGTIRCFASQWLALIKSAVADPAMCLNDISLMSEEERAHIDALNRATAREYPALLAGKCMPDLFEAAVPHHADETALTDSLHNVVLTYAEMNGKCNALAAHIKDTVSDVVDDSQPQWKKAIAIFIPRSAAYVQALFAIAKLGVPYVPIDVKVPEERARYIMHDSGSVAVLTTAELREAALAAFSGANGNVDSSRVIVVDDLLAAAPSVMEVSNPTRKITDSCVMYVIYTSGSTGRPKGVMVHHRAVVNLCHWFVEEYKVVPGDVSAQVLGAAFDPVTVELWPYLICGASVCVMDDDSKFGGAEATVRFLRKHSVTHITFPTALSQIIFDTYTFPEKGFPVRNWSVGGDKFRGCSRALPFNVTNAYGPTETTVLVTQYPINYTTPSRAAHDGAPRAPESARISVGPPLGWGLSNTGVHVLDKELRPVPRGVVGELCITGAQVAIGYRGNRESTAKAFVRDPFRLHDRFALTTRNGGKSFTDSDAIQSGLYDEPRMYMTGDLVRMDHDYNIFFVGRKDTQVKIRGFRIELGEIESQMAARSEVQHVAVVARNSAATGEARLFAFITLKTETTAANHGPIKRALLRHLRSKLPEYMVPIIVILDTMPLTTNNKIDRSSLVVPEDAEGDGGGASNAAGDSEGASGFTPPTTETEQKMCEIWTELLRTKPIGVTDNWYDKGGSSLTSTLLLSRMRQVFQMEVSINQFFLDPTVSGLVKLVNEKGHATVAASLTKILEEDASTLDQAISCSEALLPYNPLVEPASFLLTGATGFLGAFLAHELLVSRPKAKLFCLVRAGSENEAASRIVKNLERFQLLHPSSGSATGTTREEATSPNIDAGRVLDTPLVDDPRNGKISQSFSRKASSVNMTSRAASALTAASSSNSLALGASTSSSQRLQHLTFDDVAERVIPVIGDLALPHFGLSAARFSELCAVIDVIIHNGALVNFSYPYVSLKAANVGGTVTCLRMATTHHMKPLHFVSTLSVAPTPDDPCDPARGVQERVLGPATDALHGGYTQTKWVAEKLVALAATRGVPVTIHRPGRITGHSRTGCTNVDDFLNLFIKGCLEMGCAPTLEMPCDMTPVDFCAAAIVHASLTHHQRALQVVEKQAVTPSRGLSPMASLTAAPPQAPASALTTPTSPCPSGAGGAGGSTRPPLPVRSVSLAAINYSESALTTALGFVYHVTTTSSMPWDEVLDVVVRTGGYRRLEMLPYPRWRNERLLQLTHESHSTLLPLVPMFGPEFESDVAPLKYATDNLRRALVGTTIECPPTDAQLVSRYVRYFQETRFLPPVGRPSAGSA